ncbi:sulfatase [Halosquirtibacter xylanolyticus]|uniref:sulfatase family protein n=1 Tax=Halosquirtibacter xylanolyticus TaxID=3374599 RepID=UPI003749941D|nr:sulfatase [Prolixibacteraceae bacterium]
MKNLLYSTLALALGSGCVSPQAKEESTPNVIIIFTDDQGYQDLGCYGSEKIKTPNIDKLANNGIRFTDFYVSNSVCSPSRASLLTGRFPARHGVGGALFPGESGLAPKNIILSEILKKEGYHTACYGKWHLGDVAEQMPLNQGFDEYFGIPYSNDMYIGVNQQFADNVKFRDGFDLSKAKADQDTVAHTKKFKDFIDKGLSGRCPLFEGNKIVEYPCDQATLTNRYFNRAIDFIDQSKGEPFFVYITPAMPHVPLHASASFKGKSEGGAYGDAVEEIDWNVGMLINNLKEKGILDNTIIIFASDNGPWLKMGDQAGSAAPLRDGKGSIFEGGIRIPCIMSWPHRWEKGKVSHNMVSTYDLVPTIAAYAHADVSNLKLDGNNQSKHLEDITQKVGNDTFAIFRRDELSGIRVGDWKYLRFGGDYHKWNKEGVAHKPLLFNLKEDLAESVNRIEDEPEVVEMMKKRIEELEASF